MFGTHKTIARLDEMLTEAINGTFTETNYDETELSRLESKFRQYLTGKEMVTEKVEAERTAIKELVTNISHQTKTPLANICLYTQLLEEISLGEMLPYVRQIRLQAEKLEFLIHTLTKISRLESDMIRLQPRPQPILPLIRQSLQDAQVQADAKAIRLHLSDIEKTPNALPLKVEKNGFSRLNSDTDQAKETDSHLSTNPIRAVFDTRWTKEALGNLLDNAIKYSPKGSTVTITPGAWEMFVHIDVEDEGPGIPEGERAQIFDRFYRGKNASPQEGNGVGLYLTRMILQREGGYVKVSPRQAGGSCFSLYLPKG